MSDRIQVKSKAEMTSSQEVVMGEEEEECEVRRGEHTHGGTSTKVSRAQDMGV